MDLFPAIDLRAGRVVRLLRGDYEAETAYDDDPVGRALTFAAAGARWVHVVDLDAARTGEPVNLGVIGAICAELDDRGVRVQVGGGVRSDAAAVALLEAGAARVVVGTAAVEDPALVDTLGERWPGRVAVGLDARVTAAGEHEVAVRGWTQGSGRSLLDLAQRFDAPEVGALVVTSIDTDGTMEGPDLAVLGEVLAATAVDVIASGGVGTMGHLEALAGLEVRGRTLAGAIIGRALYEGRFELEEAIRACSPSG
ncbi:MAG: 1-(5-phosphoribosyl)-5-((5-phosphoribosylamino)methylideneamino)imidazole-4-carboxamide isomerase [Actinobacteria bacterium]|nr:1-(5-phosphoribosyl)-5-((5-phosphoribosylamino)methylideneamino)imidazole-4-carboxamide isomerase [Actinomycetota bacterium]